ncbi:MAG TPA: transposase [Anaerolineales bacterium]|nr:transposase [Anaerolineales bacterium]
MKNGKLLDLYSDYLISAFGQTTATGLSSLLNGDISHDQLQRWLAGKEQSSADLWRVAKPHVRKIESPEGVAIVDDSIAEKQYTDENDIICWHYDHSQQRTVKGINFVTCLYHNCGVSLPVGFELVRKTERYIDPKDGKEKRRSDKTKNEMYRDLLQQAVKNQIPFKYALNDIWFASAENMNFVKLTLRKEFIMPLKGNRKVALSVNAKQQGRYQRVDTLELEPMNPVTVYLEGAEFALLLIKQVFTNEDGSTGIQYLVTSDTTLDSNGIITIYQKRWNVEPYHKSLKQNASLEKSPTQTVTTQTNHFFAALCGYIKLELLKGETKLNHFALKSKLYLHAIHAAYAKLRELNPAQLAA